MKEKTTLVICILLVAVIAGFLLWYNLSLEDYQLPFSTEEVVSVTMSISASDWVEYKLIEDQVQIQDLVNTINKSKVAADYDEQQDEVAPGITVATIRFHMEDGTQIVFHSHNAFLGTIFSADGASYKLYGFNGVRYWNQLDCEILTSLPTIPVEA